LRCAGQKKSTERAKEKDQERKRIVYHGDVTKPLSLKVDRSAKTTLAEQIRSEIATAIESGVLEQGARLPSWQDLAAQLGVARGTVRTAYEKLRAARLIVAFRATGTRIAPRPRAVVKSEQRLDPGSLLGIYRELTQGPAFFQMDVPAAETFPATLFARIRAHAVRVEASAAPIYPDPRRARAQARDSRLSRHWHRLFAVADHRHRWIWRRAGTGVPGAGSRRGESLDRRFGLPVRPKGA
jgi:DNA-binding transcriptional regulator YhcF (GntR family)